jgi:pimeloyl-ACP methyl ester carboxylesterase
MFDNLFTPNPASGLGMRYSVWCSEQMAFEKAEQLNRQEELLPFLKGYAFNNVDQKICDCWQVAPLPPEVKTPVYSNKPVLLGAGDTDPWCSPFYNDLIHHYLPNSQRLLFVNRTHTPMLSREGFAYIHKFLDHPNQELKSTSNGILIY